MPHRQHKRIPNRRQLSDVGQLSRTIRPPTETEGDGLANMHEFCPRDESRMAQLTELGERP